MRRFALDPRARVLTPDAPGLAALVGCLREGRSIAAGPDPAAPVAPAPGPGGWLLARTSGSGGAPKVVRRRAESWAASAALHREVLGAGPDDVYGVPGHLSHSLALYAAVEALTLGAGLALCGGRGARGQVEALREAAATLLWATPAQLHLLAGTGAALPAVRLAMVGGGRLDAGARARIAALCPNAGVRVFYGAAETSFVAWGDGAEPAGSVGRAYPGVDLRIGADGRIWAASPYLFDGYAEGGSAATERDGAFVTVGDLGRLDAGGHLFVTGRADRVVTVADRSLSLDAVEAALADAGATGVALTVPDPARGARLLCVVEGPEDAATAARIRAACRALGGHAVPVLRFVDALPMLPAGKPDRARLAREAREWR